MRATRPLRLWLQLSIVAMLFAGTIATADQVSRSGYERPYKVDWDTGFSEGLGEVEVNGKWGFIDASGTLVVAAEFDQARPFSSGRAAVRFRSVTNDPKAAMIAFAGAWCWIDRESRRHSAKGFTICGPYRNGLAVAGSGGNLLSGPPKFGYAGPDGQLDIPANYLMAYDFSEGLAAVVADKMPLKGYINTRGDVVIPPRFLWASKFEGGRALVLEGDTNEIIDAAGRVIAQLEVERVLQYRFDEGMCGIMSNGMCGFVNADGQVVIECRFDWADPFHEGLAAAARGGKFGFIDRQGSFVIEPQFDAVLEMDGAKQPYHPDPYTFSEGLAAVVKDGKWGYIDRNGRWVIPPQFDKAGPFTEGAAKVAVDNKLGYIDRSGKYIWKPTR